MLKKLPLESTKQAASTLAADMLSYYRGNETGETPGLLPRFSSTGGYHWYESALMWAAVLDYSHATGDSRYNALAVQGLQWQAGQNHNFMSLNYSAELYSDDQCLWATAAMLAAERNLTSPPAGQPQWIELAEEAFGTMSDEARWDDECGGGLRWYILSGGMGNIVKDCEFRPSTCGACMERPLTGRISHLQRLLLQPRRPTCALHGQPDVCRVGGQGVGLDGGGRAHRRVDVCRVRLNQRDQRLSRHEHDAGLGPQRRCRSRSCLHVQLREPHGPPARGRNANATCLGLQTDGDSKWEARLSGLVDSGLETFFLDGVAWEPACEGSGRCTASLWTYRGLLHQWYATAMQVAPLMASRAAPVLKTSAEAAVRQCTGGNDGRQCGFAWANGTYDGATGARQEMCVLSAVSSLLMASTDAPYTARSSGGIAGTDETTNSSDGQAAAGSDGGEAPGSRSAGGRAAASALAAATLACAASVAAAVAW